MKIKIIAFVAFAMYANSGFSQAILDGYIQEGFAKNQSIQQQSIALEKSMYALKEAKSLFLPNVVFHTDYFRADGGRTVDFPAGDLLNPVYGTLNQLTNSSDFPQIENESILLNPNNFYDAKFRSTLPLLNREIAYNRRIKGEQVSLQQVEIALYKRELAKEIKQAYFQYLQSDQSIKIYESALELVNENKRINESLFANGKVNRTVLFRADNEIASYIALLETSRQNTNSAKAYFNFLLNRDLTDSILVDDSYKDIAIAIQDGNTISQREELQKLNIAASINKQVEGLSKSFIVPKISTFLDLGSQGFDWKFDNKTRYSFFGVSMQWELFSAGKNKYKVKQVQLENQIIESQTDYVAHQLRLHLTTAINSYRASIVSYNSAVQAFGTAQKYYSDMQKLYRENQVLFIELLDAQNQQIQAELQLNISLFDTYIKSAEIERANATFNLND
ncbi:TolC family protein [Algoriphagus sp. D3-2-R+10]|uniref:TolC family protein n=1 Tax=Algoriphagus aurantiacus TaxID=3103948 RepID=UPI002B3836A6|nr:TolC family protein [Algoriphagus sp. D3-2-R+10]MEB2778343.1 TolC family protein [Algoriphagus sp. D3-2-R+10]